MFSLLLVLVVLTQQVASTQVEDFVECEPVDTACECGADATVCIFQLYIERVFTFTKYNYSVPYSHGQGESYHINNMGQFVPLRNTERCIEGTFTKQTGSGSSDNLYCNEENVCLPKSKLCSEPITVDGKTYKTVITVNKQLPGPTLIVHEGQIVAVDVHNNLSTEGISIHWHGQHQIKTNFMDGVGLVTQCPIQPGSSFRYIFKAGPSGTFWYHSEMQSQRGIGLFGAFIVKEKDPISYPVSFIDDPAHHTLTIMDWFLEDPEPFCKRMKHGLGDEPIFTLPNENQLILPRTTGPDFIKIGINTFWSAIIHGKGRHPDLSYNQSSLNIYEVEPGQTYRFRLIHTGTMYGFRFSIDNHTLTVIATDGYLVKPLEVDYIALEGGERYDFLLEANQGGGNYWIKAETFEIIRSSGPPFKFIDHKAEAILHYSGTDVPKPTEFANILNSPRQCSPCKMLDCPYGELHPSYNIECIGDDKLRLFAPTPASEMPEEEPDITYFINMAGYAGPLKPVSSLNEKHFSFPQFPLTTYYDQNEEGSFCDINSECELGEGEGRCRCTTVMDVGSNVTVRLVISAIAEERKSIHSLHIHGHSVHVMKVGYGQYSSENGSLLGSSRDLTCRDDGNDLDILDKIRCPKPRFRFPNTTFPLDPFTVRKDTFVLPAGGYVVVQFRSNNPGYWFFHCHVELHQREGMVLIIREATDKVISAPSEMKTCSNFEIDIANILTFSTSNSCTLNFSFYLIVSVINSLLN
jgi:FtsP/CotA-like multicopper oxidase with cupredoxin domain